MIGLTLARLWKFEGKNDSFHVKASRADLKIAPPFGNSKYLILSTIDWHIKWDVDKTSKAYNWFGHVSYLLVSLYFAEGDP